MSRTMMPVLPPDLVFAADGLIPVVVQDRLGGEVLMVAWADAKALEETVRTGQAHFWSRSRKELWRKGESSGNTLLVREMRADCDRDTLLMLVDPEGPTCHTGTRTCFGDDAGTKTAIIGELARVIADRARERPVGSYTTRLMEEGLDKALKKVGEEATEVVIAAKGDTDERLAEEAADLLFHLMIAMAQRGVPFSRALDVLRRRRGGIT